MESGVFATSCPSTTISTPDSGPETRRCAARPEISASSNETSVFTPAVTRTSLRDGAKPSATTATTREPDASRSGFDSGSFATSTPSTSSTPGAFAVTFSSPMRAACSAARRWARTARSSASPAARLCFSAASASTGLPIAA